MKLSDLLDEGVSRASQELETRKEGSKEAVEYDIQKAAETLGYAAIKYFDLKQNRTSNYAFSFDKMLNAQGDTAV